MRAKRKTFRAHQNSKQQQKPAYKWKRNGQIKKCALDLDIVGIMREWKTCPVEPLGTRSLFVRFIAVRCHLTGIPCCAIFAMTSNASLLPSLFLHYNDHITGTAIHLHFDVKQTTRQSLLHTLFICEMCTRNVSAKEIVSENISSDTIVANRMVFMKL